MKLSPLAVFVIALVLALLVVFVIDPLDRSTFSTPFCLGMILMWLCLRQDAWVVLTVTIFYVVIDFYATHWFLNMTSVPVVHPYFWFFQRFGLFTVVSAMAVYVSYHREESNKNLHNVQSVLSKLPAPMVISDAAGYITYVNEALCKFFGRSMIELQNKRYVELFMNQTQEGKAMRYYIELFDDKSDGAHEVELSMPVGAHPTKGYVICMGEGSRRKMITVFQVG